MAYGDVPNNEVRARSTIKIALGGTIDRMKVIYDKQWVGVTQESGDSGDTITVDVSDREINVDLTGVTGVSSFAVGDLLYLIAANITDGGVVPASAWTKTASTNRLAAKVTNVESQPVIGLILLNNS